MPSEGSTPFPIAFSCGFIFPPNVFTLGGFLFFNTKTKTMLVTIYYNDVQVTHPPFEVYPNCPSVKVDISNAIEFAEEKLSSGEWHGYLIPELSQEQIIIHQI